MTQEEITEGNKLIANFWCGWKEGELFTYPNGGKGWIYSNMQEVKFHSSWDWLMPVVEKINNLGAFEFTIYNRQGIIWSAKYDFTPLGASKRYLISASAPTTLEAVWLTVIDFIKWYNQNIKQ